MATSIVNFPREDTQAAILTALQSIANDKDLYTKATSYGYSGTRDQFAQDLASIVNKVSKSGDTLTGNLTLPQLIATADITQKGKTLDNTYAQKALLDELIAYIGYSDNDIYGVEVNYETSTFTRLSAAVGKSAGTDFNSIPMYNRYRCILNNAGDELAKLGDAGYTETGKLTQAIGSNPVGTEVQVMVKQPRFYYKVVPLKLARNTDGTGDHILKARYYVSSVPKDGFKVHPAFIRGGQIKDCIYISAYEGSLYDTSAGSYILNDAQVADFVADKLSSVASAKPISGLTQNLTRRNCNQLAINRGSGWTQQSIQSVSASQLLFLIEYATLNTQSAIGDGIVSLANGSGNEAVNTGATSGLGNSSGSSSGSVSYRGEENPWGNIWKFVDGINVYCHGINRAYIADHSFADDKVDGQYTDTGITIVKANGYIQYFGYNEDYDWVFLPSQLGGNTAVPVGDYLYQNNTYAGMTVAFLGGRWASGAYAGGFCWNVNGASSYQWCSIGGRLLFI